MHTGELLMFRHVRLTFSLLFLSFCSISVIAQDVCPDLVQTALEYIDATCTGIERNQVCYGNLQIEAVPQPDVTDFKFDAPGDIENIASIASLNLSGMSTPDEWGVTLMSVQANLPDSTPGQNVTMLLFGDVTIENKGGEAKITLLEVTASGNVRVRSGAGTQNGQIGSLAGGTAVQADGRNEAGDWLRVQLEDGTAGWVSADLVEIAGDKTTLAVVEGTEIAGTTYGPMQAFYFTSGVGSPQCTEAPPDGILIQTPEGAGSIDLLINEVQISVGSTLYLYAQPSSILHVAVLEGQAAVTAGGTTLTVPAGGVGVVPLDENALPAGAPTLQGYTDNQAASLAGMLTLLPEQIEVAPGLTEDQLTFTPQSGEWQLTPVEDTVDCGGQGGVTAEVATLIFTEGQMLLNDAVYTQTGPGVYTSTEAVGTATAQFSDPETGTVTAELNGGGCTGGFTATLTYQGG
jgi:hypothetical protein